MKLAAWLEIKNRHVPASLYDGQRKRMDGITLSNVAGTKHLHALRLRVEEKPFLHISLNRKDGRVSQWIEVTPQAAGSLADWILEPMPAGWGFEDLIRRRVDLPSRDHASPPIELNQERAKLVCYVLNVLAGAAVLEALAPAWLVSELANAGIPVDWDSDKEHFVPKRL
jgi:hypothetical protein